MPSYTQANQPLAIDTPLGKDKLLLSRIHGVEAISQLFEFTLDCLSQEPIAFDALLGQQVTVRLSIPGCPTRYVNGIVSSLEEGASLPGPAGEGSFYRYTLELSPRLWLAGLRQQCRMFQEVAVPDILRTMLHDEWGIDYEARLTGTYTPRDYCVQYRETDLNFVRRLMEEEGICFYFLHTETSHKLVLTDHLDGHPDLPQASNLLFEAAQGGRRPEGRIFSWKKRQRLRPCRVTLRDHCFQLPDSSLEHSTSIQDQVPVGQKQHTLRHGVTKNNSELLEHYDPLGGYAWRFDGVNPEGSNQPQKVQGLFQESQRFSSLRMEALAANAVTLDGESLCGHLVPGCQFTLQRHFDGDGGYLLTRVEHQADLEAAYLGDRERAGLLYSNRFQAIPKGLPFRPPLETPKPRIPGALTAQVVGPLGSDIFVDRYGRVKVKFYWDRNQATGPMNSCWLRVGQLWAGNRWGAHFWPRVGHEVIVSFIDGNPDRPLITGSVYNENLQPPYELPANKALAGIKSNTTSDGGSPSDPMRNYSGWLINDAQGQEHIEIHGERHIGFFAEQTELHNINGPQRLNVNGIHSVHVGSLPGGSGSGGDEGRNPDQPYIITEGTLGGDIGVALTSTCGVSQSVILGVFSTLTVGDFLNIVVNPIGMATDLGLAIPGASVLGGIAAATASPFLGFTNITMGSQVQLSYGTNVTVMRGAKAAIAETGRATEGELEPGEAPWAIAAEALMALSACLATAGTIQASVNGYDTSQAEWLVFLDVSTALTGALEMIEVHRAISNQVAKAEQAALAATALSSDANTVTAIASTITSMFGMEPLVMNSAKLIKGNTCEYNDAVRMIGGDYGVMIYSGSEEGKQTALTINPTETGLYLGVPLVGPRWYMNATENTIVGAVGPEAVGTQFSLTPTLLAISIGEGEEGSQISLTEAGITLSAGLCKIVLTMQGTISLVTPTASITLADGTITLTSAQGCTIDAGNFFNMIANSCVLGVTELTSRAIMQIE